METGIRMQTAQPGAGCRRQGRRVRQFIVAALLFAGPTSPVGGETGRIVPFEALAPTAKHRQVAREGVGAIDRHVSSKLWMRDELGARVLQRFLEAWDPERGLLLAADVREFERQRHGISDALRNGELEFAFDVFRRIWARLEERTALSFRLLDAGFDFSLDEYLVTDPARRGWAQDWATLSDHWRRRVKNDFIELHLAGHPPSEINEVLRTRYARLQGRARRIGADTVVERVLDAYARALDRHGAYLSARSIERLRIRSTGALEGIGVVLRAEGEYAVVDRIVPGGPADRSRAIGVGDRILAIRQSGDRRRTDVLGWPVVDVVERLRGPKGTAVRLRILPAGVGTAPSTVTLIRDRIALEDQAAKGRIVRLRGAEPHGSRIGVVEVPSFHVDDRIGQVRDDASTSGDVRRIVRTLRAQGIDGLVLDLRRNRGGSLNQAVRTGGLFITTGPIVQVRTRGGETRVYEDPDPGVEWDGALSVLVGPESASASEIVAAAMQDYRRGLVVGERTFGKGSAQSILRLYENGGEGALRLTTSRWFRVSGETIERRGVRPDLDFSRAAGSGRRIRPYVPEGGPQSRVGATRWNRGELDARTVEWLGGKSRDRIGTNQAFGTLREEASERNGYGVADRVSLNLEARRNRHEQQERRLRRRMRALGAGLAGYGEPVSGLEATSLAALREALILEETIRVTGDLARVWKPN